MISAIFASRAAFSSSNFFVSPSIRVWRAPPEPEVDEAEARIDPAVEAAVLARARWPADARVGLVAVDVLDETDKLARGLAAGVVGFVAETEEAVRVEAVDEVKPFGPDAVVRARAAAVGAVALEVEVRDAPDPATRADGTAGFVVLGRTRGVAVDVADAPAAGPTLGRLDADAAVGAVAVLVLEVRERGRMTGEPGPVDEDEAVFGRGGGTLS